MSPSSQTPHAATSTSLPDAWRRSSRVELPPLPGAVTPLYDADRDAREWVPPLDVAISCAREALAKHAGANIHDTEAMVTAAVSLDCVLRDVLAALDKAVAS
ncbi:hypothetical protein [Streptomyces sp. NPDC048057]|uniref:hypothetical protein n=1 Tax=Streptomyces sp. NPDC048057 TaxID=3155628 RepID=UPI0033FED326